MEVPVVLLTLVAFIAAPGVNSELSSTASYTGAVDTSYTNQPVVVVKKTTYYEPELVAVVVERGVDDIPEEAILVQNYADVLGSSNDEIRLCVADNTNTCLDTPVTKFYVPSLFQSIGQNGFHNFFQQAKDVPWIATLDDDVKLVNPYLSPKKSSSTKVFNTEPNLDYYKPVQVVPSDIFKYIPDTPSVPGQSSSFQVVPAEVFKYIPETSTVPGQSSSFQVVPAEVFKYIPETSTVPGQSSSFQVVPAEVFKYIPETSTVTEYHTTVPTQTSTIPNISRREVSQPFPVSYGITHANYLTPTTTTSQTTSTFLPSNLQGAFAPLNQISGGGSILGGATSTTAYQPYPTTYYPNTYPTNSQVFRHRRAIGPYFYYY